jgi:hypothetical protein
MLSSFQFLEVRKLFWRIAAVIIGNLLKDYWTPFSVACLNHSELPHDGSETSYFT